MRWLKKIINKLFPKKIRLIEQPKIERKNIETNDDFRVMIRKSADLESDDGNGYKIIPNLKLKDMV